MLLSVTEGNALSKPTDLLQGTLDLLILKVIALEPMHGWAIAQRIRQMSGEVLQVGQGALYPCLHKLERNGWISSEWAVSENNRRAKYHFAHCTSSLTAESCVLPVSVNETG